MKKILAFVSVLHLAWAAAAQSGPQPVQMLRLEEHMAQEIELPYQAEVSVASVLQTLHETQAFIQQHLKFPQSAQDQKAAGVIFGRLIPLMESYIQLRRQDPSSAREAGVAIAGEMFVSKDGVAFDLENFIEVYVASITIPSLAQEFIQFRENISQDIRYN